MMTEVEARLIVAVGASAGGLEALRAMFDEAPGDANLAFVVVQHLSPDYRSMMAELLSRHTKLKVRQACEGVAPAAGCIDLIQPQTVLRLRGGRLRVEEVENRGHGRPIDTFMESVAEDRGPNCVGVVLSGTGSDGTAGLHAIRQAGGVTIVQDPNTAAFDGMPRAALRDRNIDLILPPERIVSELLDLERTGSSLFFKLRADVANPILSKVLQLLHRDMGVDFHQYKPNTVMRRIERRMKHHKADDPREYLEYLDSHPEEIRELHADLLINVTRFFRDAGAIEVVKSVAIPRLLGMQGDDPLRIWVAGCATGEEAFTVAMLLWDALRDAGSSREFRVFATDVDITAIERATRGEFDAATISDLAPDLVERHFVQRGDRFVVRKSLRDTLVFSKHDVIEDPPFSRLHMVTCRNLLIYLRVATQERVLRVFSSALHDNGMLWLGSSETVGGMADHFDQLDNRWKLYAARPGRKRQLDASIVRKLAAVPVARRQESERDRTLRGLAGAMKGWVPPMLLVDSQLKLLHREGDLSGLLQVPTGGMSLDVREMLPKSLSPLLTTARARCRDTSQDVVYPGLRVSSGEVERTFDMRVRQIVSARADEDMMAIFFDGLAEAPVLAGEQSVDPSQIPSEVQLQLEATEQELRHTRENLQATIEELESANEELQSTNEELLASNEELQSVNEELQSVNEELHTVNYEHQQKVAALGEMTDDLNGVLTSINASILVISDDLQLRRYNEAALSLFNIIPEDIGRPIEHITHKLDVADLAGMCERVCMTTLAEVVHCDGHGGLHLLLQVVPRQTAHASSGAVVVVTDVTSLVNAERRFKSVSTALYHVAFPLCIIDSAGVVTEANDAFASASGRDREWIIGQDIRDLSADGERAHLGKALATVAANERWSGIVQSRRPDGTKFWEAIDIIPLPDERGRVRSAMRLSTVVDDMATEEVVIPDAAEDADFFFIWNLVTGRISGTVALGALFAVDEWHGGTVDDLLVHVHPDDRSLLKQRAAGTSTQPEPFTLDCRVLALGVRAVVELRSQPIPHPPNGQAVIVSRCRPRGTAEA